MLSHTLRASAGPPVSRGDDLKCQGLAVQALKSSYDTLGSFLTKATMVQISRSGTSMAPKLGMPVMLTPFLMTQNSCGGEISSARSLRSGGSGRKPSENLAQFTPGPP